MMEYQQVINCSHLDNNRGTECTPIQNSEPVTNCHGLKTAQQEAKLKDSGIPWIGAIPEHWERLNMKRNVSFHKGSIPKQWSDVPLEIPYLSMDYLRGRGDGSTLFPIHDSSLLIANETDLLVLWDGANAGEFIRSKYGYVGSTMAKLSYNPEKLNHDYLFFFLKSMEIVSKDFANGTTIPHFTPTFLAGNYPIPPLEEQERIAAWLDGKCGEIDELIDVEQQMISDLEAYRQAVITEAVTHGLNPDAPTKPTSIPWLPQIPQHWEECRLKNLTSQMNSGENLTSLQIKDTGLFEVFGGNGVRGYYDSYNFDGEAILIGRQGALCGNVHYVNKQLWATDHAVITIPSKLAMAKYLYYLCIAMNLNQYASQTAAQPGLAVGQIKNILTTLPPLTEQQEIADYLDAKCAEIDELIKVKQEKIEKLRQYRQSLIFEAVTGKTPVNSTSA